MDVSKLSDDQLRFELARLNSEAIRRKILIDSDVKMHSIKQAARITGVSTQLIGKLANNGTIRTVRIGGRVLIPVKETKRLVRDGTE